MTSNPAPSQFATRAQHDATIPKDVQVLGGAAAPQGEQLDGATQREVGEFQQHWVGLRGGMWRDAGSSICRSSLPSVVGEQRDLDAVVELELLEHP